MKNSDSLETDPVIKKIRQDSNFRAIKNLIEADNSLKVAQNRIRVLQTHENRNAQKMQNQMGLIQKIQQVRQFSNEHNQYIEATKQQIQHETDMAHSKYLQISSDHKQKIKQVYEDLKKGRKWHYLTIEEKSQEAKRQISESKKKEQKEKEMHRNVIVAAQQNGKHNLVKFHETKQSRLKESKSSEVELIKAKEANKKKELRDLGNLQMQLLQRQSQSQAAYLQVKGKLDTLLNTVKLQNTRSKKSLQPSIHFQARQNEI